MGTHEAGLQSAQMESHYRGLGMHGIIVFITICIEFLAQFIPQWVGRQSQIQSRSLYYDFLDLYKGVTSSTDDQYLVQHPRRNGSEQHFRGDGHDGAGHDRELRRLLLGGLEEHQADLNRILQSSQRASQMFEARESLLTDDEEIDW